MSHPDCIKGLHVKPYLSPLHGNYYCSECKQGMGNAYYAMRRELETEVDRLKKRIDELEKPTEPTDQLTINLHTMFMEQLHKSAAKSPWIPPDYMVNDWIADCCKFLESPRQAPPRYDFTIRELQAQLPWTVHYHRDFRASPMVHKDFGHALLHVLKACGKIASIVNDAEHGGSEFKPEEVDRYVADLVVCALRMATTCPGRQIDLQRAVEDRIENKNSVNLER